MKHFFFLLLATLWLSPTLFAQNVPLQAFIDQHKNDQRFTYAFLSKDLFAVTANSDLKNEDWKGLQNAVKNIGSLRILAADSISNALPLYKEAKKLVSGDAFDEVLTVRDGNQNVRIWVKSEAQTVSDLVLLVGAPNEFVLVCFAGNLELGNLAELADLFEAGKATQLAQNSETLAIDFAVSPNPTNGQITLTYANEQDPPALLSMMDQNGRLIAEQNLAGVPTQQLTLNDLKPGIYWLQLKTRGGKVGIKQIQIMR